MHSLRILIILFLLLGVIIFFQVVTPFTVRRTEKKVLPAKTEVKKKDESPSPAAVLQSPTLFVSLTPTPSSPDKIGNKLGSKIEQSQNSTHQMSMYAYPNATIISQNNTELILESSADTDVITDWYRSVFVSENMTANATAKTKTNGNVLNKLVSSKNGKKTSVEISKNSDESTVRIKINMITS